MILGLGLIPLCIIVGSFIPIGGGSAMFIGFIVGIALSYVFFTYGPGRKKNALPTTYYLSQQQQLNGGVNQHAVDVSTLSAHEAVSPPVHHPHGFHN